MIYAFLFEPQILILTALYFKKCLETYLEESAIFHFSTKMDQLSACSQF